MAKYYENVDNEFIEYFNQVLNNKDNQAINSYNIRWGLIFCVDDKATIDNMTSLPYNTKVCSAKDVLLKKIDVEVIVDRFYWTSLIDEKSKIALMDSIINSINVVFDKEGFPIFLDDGRVKIKAVKPDMEYRGYSKISEKYGEASPEVKTLRTLKRLYLETFEKIY